MILIVRSEDDEEDLRSCLSSRSPAAAANANVCHVLCPKSGHWMEAAPGSRWQRRLLSRCYQDVITRLPQPRTMVTNADNDDDNNNSRSDTSFLTIHTPQFDIVSFKSIPRLI